MTTNYTEYRKGSPSSEGLRKRIKSGKAFVFSHFLQQQRLLDEMQELNMEAIRHILGNDVGDKIRHDGGDDAVCYLGH